MNQYKIFINLTRLNRPIGFMLLFWPCAWGLTYSIQVSGSYENYLKHLALFFLGSILMRSAGCIFNDIVDRKIDSKVKRTKYRPIASKKISVERSLIYVFFLCIAAFLVLIQFNLKTIMLGIGSMFFAFSYPYMKRITYWPQLFLGLTFSWGLIMACASMNIEITLNILLFYLSATFWTLGYDTIYGLQDIVDDEIIGMKSTSIKFKNNPKFFVFLCYSISTFLIFLVIKNYLSFNFSLILFIFFVISLIYQIKIFDKKKPLTCLNAFKINNFSGLAIFFGLLTLNI